MLNAPQAQNPIRQVPNLSAAAFQDNHLKTMVVIQVHVGGREDLARSRMLGFNQLGGEIGLVVVVNHGQRSHNHFVFFRRLLHKMLANEVPYGLRAVLIALVADGLVELLEKFPFQGKSGSNQIAHCLPPNRNSNFDFLPCLLQVLIEPLERALGDVPLVFGLPNGVTFVRVDHQLGLHAESS